jgi:hypothetical protein
MATRPDDVPDDAATRRFEYRAERAARYSAQAKLDSLNWEEAEAEWRASFETTDN